MPQMKFYKERKYVNNANGGVHSAGVGGEGLLIQHILQAM